MNENFIKNSKKRTKTSKQGDEPNTNLAEENIKMTKPKTVRCTRNKGKPNLEKVKNSSNEIQLKMNNFQDDKNDSILGKKCAKRNAKAKRRQFECEKLKLNDFDEITKLILKINNLKKVFLKNSFIDKIADNVNENDKKEEKLLLTIETDKRTENVDYGMYFINKSKLDLIENSFDDFLEKFIKKVENANLKKFCKAINNKFKDRFNIGLALNFESLNAQQDLFYYAYAFQQLIDTFIDTAPILQLMTSDGVFINESEIIKKYVNLFVIKTIEALNHLNSNDNDNDRFPLHIFLQVSLLQKICLHTLKLKNNANTFHFVIDVLTSIDAVGDYFKFIQFQPEKSSLNSIQSQLLALLVISLIDIDHYFTETEIYKFFQLLKVIFAFQSKLFDFLFDQMNRINFNYENDENCTMEESIGSSYLFLLHACLALNTFHQNNRKFQSIISVNNELAMNQYFFEQSFMIDEYFQLIFSKLFNIFPVMLKKKIFLKYYQYLFDWHCGETLDQQLLPIHGKFTTTILLIIIFETFSRLMQMLPRKLAKKNVKGKHLHLFWMLFTLIKLKSGLFERQLVKFDKICCTFETAIEPLVDIVWSELPFETHQYFAQFILAYINNFGQNSVSYY